MGQLRVAFVAVSIVLVSVLGLRHTLPALLARGGTLGDPARRDLDYVATRTLVSRRAFDVDGMRFGIADTVARPSVLPFEAMSRAVGLWDGAALRQRLSDGTRTAASGTLVQWFAGAEDGTLAALYARRPAPGSDEWMVRGANVTVPVLRDTAVDLHHQRTDTLTAPADQSPVVAPGLRGSRVLADTAGFVRGTPMGRTATRLAHAWSERDPSLLSADSVAGDASRFVSHRDVRDRVALLAPVFAQGTDILPVMHEGMLYWMLDLYSASDSYPLSQRWMAAGAVRSYFHHAATALVEAATGRVRLVTVRRPDPVARTWRRLVPSLFVSYRELPQTLADRLPVPADGAIAQLRTFARYGARLEGQVSRLVADSALAGSGPVPHLLPTPGGATLGWSVPLLDAGELLGGVVTAVGGRERGVYWDSTAAPRTRWTTLLERLRVALDSARGSLPEASRREPRMRPGRVQTVLTDAGPVLVQPLQWNRGEGNVVITRVAVLPVSAASTEPGSGGAIAGSRVGVGMTIAEAVTRLGGGAVPSPSLPIEDPAYREPAATAVPRLYDAMRQAMRRGDWPGFGAAFDSLGRALGRPPE